jgi:ankyrin repeat protein
MELDDDDLIKSLLTYGAKIESRSDGQRSYQPSGSFALPLVLAVRRRKCEIARVLIQGGADVNLHNPLCIAVENQDLEMVQVLMSHGADPNQPSLKQAWTPLFYAVQARNCLLIDLLALGGANINPTDLYKQTPLHVALRGSDTGVDVDVVRELVALGANVDVADQWDDTPLALICVHDRSLAILLTEGTGCELTVYPNALRKLEEAGYTSDMTTKDAREILRSSIDTTNHWLVCW